MNRRWPVVVGGAAVAAVLTGCASQGSTAGAGPTTTAPITTTSTEPEPLVTPAPTPDTVKGLVAKWEPELRGVSEPCLQKTISRACTRAAAELGTLAQGLAADADTLGLTTLEVEAQRIADETAEWRTVCLATAAKGEQWPDRCAVDIYSTVRLGDRTLIGELYAAQRAN